MKKVLFCVAISVIGIFFLWRTASSRHPQALLSPLGSQQFIPLQRPATYEVYGFAPYWNLQKIVIQPELTHLAYFDLPITPEGKLDGLPTTGPSTSRTRWESQRLATTVAQLRPGQKFVIVFSQFNNNEVEQLLSSSTAKAEFRQSVSQLLRTSPYPISGINLDIEYLGEATPELRQQYVELVQVLHDLSTEQVSMGRAPLEISICVFASAGNKQMIWDLKALEPVTDKVVIMAYDFHRASSPLAGPVAPIFGGRTQWSSDILSNLRAFTEAFPSQKILLGVPFYGYEWETTSDSAVASTFPGTGSTASYTRVQQLLKDNSELNIVQHWNEDSLSPYVTFTRNNRTHLIHYDDARSLSFKLDLVKDAQLGGIAIWALGYEADSRPLWDVIHTKFSMNLD